MTEVLRNKITRTKMLPITKYVVYAYVEGDELTFLKLVRSSMQPYRIVKRRTCMSSWHQVCIYTFKGSIWEYSHPKKKKSILPLIIYFR